MFLPAGPRRTFIFNFPLLNALPKYHLKQITQINIKYAFIIQISAYLKTETFKNIVCE